MVAPLPLGVNVAVYIVELAALKLLMAPPLTLMSPSAKSVVASLLVKVKVSVASFGLEPLDTALPPAAAVPVRAPHRAGRRGRSQRPRRRHDARAAVAGRPGHRSRAGRRDARPARVGDRRPRRRLHRRRRRKNVSFDIYIFLNSIRCWFNT